MFFFLTLILVNMSFLTAIAAFNLFVPSLQTAGIAQKILYPMSPATSILDYCNDIIELFMLLMAYNFSCF